MKIGIASDVHSEHYRDKGYALAKMMDWSEPDLLILAGDIGNINTLDTFFDYIVQGGAKNIVYVPGNHEYYGGYINDTDDWIGEACSKHGVHNLNSTYKLTLCGKTFAGRTLWYREEPTTQYLEKFMNDFNLIKDNRQDIYDLGVDHFDHLIDRMHDTEIIVSHVPPTFQAIHPRFAGNPMNRFFVHDLESYILDHQPKLWVCGHVHNGFDIEIGETRVIANPFGYPGEFQERPELKVIDL